MANTFLPPTPVDPRFQLITNITRSFPMVITVQDPNNYVVGQLVHLSVPESYGMLQADQRTGEILAINGLNFTVNIDSIQFSAFIIPPVFSEKPASLTSAGSRNLYNISTVPFHSASNQGN